MRDLLIVGGGITGLAAAFRLSRLRRGAEIEVIEASDRLGGRIGTEHHEGYTIEHGPDCFLARKPQGIALCDELGIGERLIGRDERHRRSYILRNGGLHVVPEGMTGLVPADLRALDHSALLSEAGKRRFAQERDLPPRETEGEESIASFATRRYGEEAFTNLIEPLLGGIFAGRAEELSLEATFPRLRALELAHGSVTAGLTAPNPEASRSDATRVLPPFVSFPSGMGFLVDSLAAELPGVRVSLQATVRRIERCASGYRLIVEEHGVERVLEGTAVLLTTPLYRSARLVERLDSRLAELLDSVGYASSALINLAFPSDLMKRFDGYGYVIPRAESRKAIACTWSSMKWRNRAPEGAFLLRVYCGRYGGEDPTACSDEELVETAREELAATMGLRAEPVMRRVVRHRLAIPQYTVGHLERIRSIESTSDSHPGLFHAGAAFGGVGIPDCIASGERAASRIAEFIRALRT